MRADAPRDGSFEEPYFRENYGDYTLHNPPRKIDFYRALAEQSVPGIERPRVLEVGCAFGLFLSALGPRWERYGSDLSAYAIEHARRSVPEARFVQAGAADRPFEGSFDLIAAFDVLEHVPDLEAVARTARASLRPNGRLLFVVPVYDGPTGPIVRLLDRDPTHVHKGSRAFWLDWTARFFHLDAWWGISRYLLPGGYYLHWPTQRLRRFTPAIAILAHQREDPRGTPGTPCISPRSCR